MPSRQPTHPGASSTDAQSGTRVEKGRAAVHPPGRGRSHLPTPRPRWGGRRYPDDGASSSWRMERPVAPPQATRDDVENPGIASAVESRQLRSRSVRDYEDLRSTAAIRAPSSLSAIRRVEGREDRVHPKASTNPLENAAGAAPPQERLVLAMTRERGLPPGRSSVIEVIDSGLGPTGPSPGSMDENLAYVSQDDVQAFGQAPARRITCVNARSPSPTTTRTTTRRRPHSERPVHGTHVTAVAAPTRMRDSAHAQIVVAGVLRTRTTPIPTAPCVPAATMRSSSSPTSSSLSLGDDSRHERRGQHLRRRVREAAGCCWYTRGSAGSNAHAPTPTALNSKAVATDPDYGHARRTRL